MTEGQQYFFEAVKENAYRTEIYECQWIDDDPKHEGCEVTEYSVSVIMTYGSVKSHRMTYHHHSAPGELLGGSSPSCGSKRWGSPQAYNMRPERFTCGRCWDF
tara:strand:+ start:534 stop:842 length:309 start_codon:yes stop_codon:yes gene_type:complete